MPPVQTKHRSIETPIPVPASIPLLERMRQLEPRSMGGQPAVVWDHGNGATISDAYGNTWIDFSAGVLVTSSGHGRKEIIDAIKSMADHGLYHAYCFSTEIRLKLVQELSSWLPAPLKRVFLLTTGAEATECCIKLARTHGANISADKNILITFENGFHGRTMGAQLAGGSAGLKSWLGGPDPRFVQVPFPDGFRQPDTSFDAFEQAFAEREIDPHRVCGVMGETYQGCNAALMPPPYAQSLRKWCDTHNAADDLRRSASRLRTDGKAVRLLPPRRRPRPRRLRQRNRRRHAPLGRAGNRCPDEPVRPRRDDQHPLGQHRLLRRSTGEFANHPQRKARPKTPRKLAPILRAGAEKIAKASRGLITRVDGVGLVVAMQFTKPGTTEPNPEPAWQMVKKSVECGVMLFAPVGVGGCAIKINPPLMIDEETLVEAWACSNKSPPSYEAKINYEATKSTKRLTYILHVKQRAGSNRLLD